MNLSSSSFGDGEEIPQEYTADGANLSPPLSWSGVPRHAKSLALLVEDPDAPDPSGPTRSFVHWVVFNIQPSTNGLPLGADRTGLPAGAREGRNDFGRSEYGGPSPPLGRHRYFFRLYALDDTLPDRAGRPDRRALLDAMNGHILGQAELMGTYERSSPTRGGEARP
jgi:Raf kinase inhibitor-like YbhB/YbcL family protein